jgi:hypothetical protein
VMALSTRMESRDLSEANEEFNGFEKDMQAAAAAMAPSAEKLRATQWKDAILLEQKALQALLHAEATFRQIQVAFGQQGGGGGANSAGRDLASLFDLELDTEKNQYETAQSTSPAEQHQKDVEDALAKLDLLAQRQQDLANQQRNSQQSFQERWQQEMLRREAEQLQRQLEQLAHNQQGQQQNGQQGSNGTSSEQSGSQQQQAASQSNAQGSDQRITQALARLRQAGEAMKRSGSPQQSAEAERQAVNSLREAESLLSGAQQQLASGKLGTLSREADQLAQEERTQADRINNLAGQQSDSEDENDATAQQLDREHMMERLRQRNQLAGERQRLYDDLSRLQKSLRDTARDLAPNQPGVSEKLRDALTEMDQADLDNHVQRTADWLRSGINPNTNGTENEIAQGLQKLSQQLRQAQQAVGKDKPGQSGRTSQGDETLMLGQVQRLRRQLDAMTASSRGNGLQGQNSQSDGRNSNDRRSGKGGSQQAEGQQSGAPQNGSIGQLSRNGAAQGGDVSGDVRYGGGGADGPALGNVNTGNNRYDRAEQRPVPSDPSGNPEDKERFYQQGIRELNQLRQMVQSDPEAAKEVRELARQMQQLDPHRFPGNPEIVEQMHREVLSSLDRIELQLQRNSSTEARTAKSFSIPDGYQDSVADYYKRLSKTNKN